MEALISAKVLTTPWQIQVALGSGYLAYMAAYVGIREHHKAIDTTFRAIAFGLVATAVLMFVPADRPLTSIAGAVAAALASGLAWRRFGIDLWGHVLRRADVSWSDDTPSAWIKLIINQNHYVSQVSVLTTDGRWLRCDDTTRFADAPFGPCVLGTNGDVILYTTHVGDAAGVKEVEVLNDHYGARATYVPASQVRQVNIRHKSKG